MHSGCIEGAKWMHWCHKVEPAILDQGISILLFYRTEPLGECWKMPLWCQVGWLKSGIEDGYILCYQQTGSIVEKAALSCCAVSCCAVCCCVVGCCVVRCWAFSWGMLALSARSKKLAQVENNLWKNGTRCCRPRIPRAARRYEQFILKFHQASPCLKMASTDPSACFTLPVSPVMLWG